MCANFNFTVAFSDELRKKLSCDVGGYNFGHLVHVSSKTIRPTCMPIVRPGSSLSALPNIVNKIYHLILIAALTTLQSSHCIGKFLYDTGQKNIGFIAVPVDDSYLPSVS